MASTPSLSLSQINDKAFENLRGIHTLKMWGCPQITDKAFENLRGIHTLTGSSSTIAKAKRVLGDIDCYEEDNEWDDDDVVDE